MADSVGLLIDSEQTYPGVAPVDLLQQRPVTAPKIDDTTDAVVQRTQSELHYRLMSVVHLRRRDEPIVGRIPLGEHWSETQHQLNDR